MKDKYWNIELLRLIGAFITALACGYITGYWLECLLLGSLLYIGWMLFKLRQLQRWLLSGQKAQKMPDSDGAWEQVVYLVNRAKQKSLSRKKKQRKLLGRFNDMMEALPDAAVILNEYYEIQWVNQAAVRLLGIKPYVDYGQRVDNLVRVTALSQYLESQGTDSIRFNSPRDEYVYLEARLLPVQKSLYLLKVRDISQRIQLQETRRSFIANASHELRTPLTVVSGYLEMLEHENDLPEHFKIAVQQSSEQALRMQQIIDDMLVLSQLENADERPGQVTSIDMPKLLQNMVDAIQTAIAQGSHQMSCEITPGLLIKGFEKQVISIVNNLLENAVKHTPEDSVIRVHWYAAETELVLDVEDNGPGIPNQYLPHLTERFYRVDKGRSRETGGTGLGLAIVKHALKNHGGYLQIESQPGKTCFSARFPIERAAYNNQAKPERLEAS